VFAYFAFGVIWCSLWVVQHTNGSDGTDVATGNAEVVSWIASSFVSTAVGLFVVEPTVQAMRFGAVAWALRRFGEGIASKVGAAKKALASTADGGVVGRPGALEPVAEGDPDAERKADALDEAMREKDEAARVARAAAFKSAEAKSKEKGEAGVGLVVSQWFEVVGGIVEQLG